MITCYWSLGYLMPEVQKFVANTKFQGHKATIRLSAGKSAIITASTTTTGARPATQQRLAYRTTNEEFNFNEQHAI